MTEITKLRRLRRMSHFMLDKPSVTVRKGGLYFSSSAVEQLNIADYKNCYISIKDGISVDEATEVSVIKHEAVQSRIDFVVELAASWTRLRVTKAAEKRIALVIANYPNKDGRLGNGVGLDTPTSIVVTLKRMIKEGYMLGADVPTTSKEIMDRLLAGPTTDS